MVSRPSLRSTFDGFLAVAAFAPMPLPPALASGDGVAPPTPAVDEPSIATTVWGMPRPSTDDGSTMSDGDRRLANLRPAATADASACQPQIVAEREGGSTLRQPRSARRR